MKTVWPPTFLSRRRGARKISSLSTSSETVDATTRDTAVSLTGAAALALVLLVTAERAWVTEDAYITFRCVDNFVNGYGLRWNVDERVQAFTHPLWALLHIPFYAVTREVFFTTLVISLGLTLAAVALALRRCAEPWLVPMLAVPLVCSKAFVDFATSGLETPATFTLLALFATELMSPVPRLQRLALWAALAATNRLDSLVLVLPALAFAVWREPGARRGPLLRGFAPLIAWEAFSLLYYGFLFPNTKYAKLDTGLPVTAHLHQGFVYVLDLVMNDPLSAGVIAIGVALSAATVRRSARPAWLASGILLYGLFVVRAGGDFMSGRFWSPCVFLAALLIVTVMGDQRARLGRAGTASVAVLLAALVVVHPPSTTFGTRAVKFGTMVLDEREFYADTNTLLNYSPSRRAIDHPFSQEGLSLRKQAKAAAAAGEKTVWVTATVGMFGYYAGPNVTVIDRIGLGDPLLARLPLERRAKFPKPGHFIRVVPEGYEEARRSGSLAAMDPSLAQYYAPLREIVAGPVFSPRRLAEVVAFNLGRYDRFRDAYVAARDARAEAAEPAASE